MKKWIWPASLSLVFFFSLGLIMYGWWIVQIERGSRALRRGDTGRAAAISSAAEALFLKVPGLSYLLKGDYRRLAFNQVAILYAQGKVNEAGAKLEQAKATAPFLAETGEYSFWSGNLLFSQAAQSKDPETSVNALKAALSEYQRGLVVQPDDWDLKYNYELVKHLLSRKGEGQKKESKSILEKMRPKGETVREEVPPEKRG